MSMSKHHDPTWLGVLDRALGDPQRTARLQSLIITVTCCVVVIAAPIAHCSPSPEDTPCFRWASAHFRCWCSQDGKPGSCSERASIAKPAAWRKGGLGSDAQNEPTPTDLPTLGQLLLVQVADALQDWFGTPQQAQSVGTHYALEYPHRLMEVISVETLVTVGQIVANFA